MSKELCFFIDDNNLYLEQVLVDYSGIPIFFLCKDEELKYYISLCTDVEDLHYIVTPVSLKDVYFLLYGKLEMRNVIIKQEYFWEIISEENIVDDIVLRHCMEDIDFSVLPEENACFKLLNEEVRLYARKIEKLFFESTPFYDCNMNLDIDEMMIIGLADEALFNDEFSGLKLTVCEIKKSYTDKNIDYNMYSKWICQKEIPLENNEEMSQGWYENMENIDLAA